MIKQEIPAHLRHSDEASPIPDLSMEHLDRLTLEAFYALLEDVDLHEVFEEFVVHAKPHHN
jgi:hypothetical protein